MATKQTTNQEENPSEAKKRKRTRRELSGFILFSILEEAIIGLIAFVVIITLIPFLLIPGMISVAIGLVLFTIVKVYYFSTSTRIPVEDPVLGTIGIAATDFVPDQENQWKGKVRLRGELWRAQSNQAILQGTQVTVTRLEGLCLIVTPALEHEGT